MAKRFKDRPAKWFLLRVRSNTKWLSQNNRNSESW